MACVSLVRVNWEHRHRAAVMKTGFERRSWISGRKANPTVTLNDPMLGQSIWRAISQVLSPQTLLLCSQKGLTLLTVCHCWNKTVNLLSTLTANPDIFYTNKGPPYVSVYLSPVSHRFTFKALRRHEKRAYVSFNSCVSLYITFISGHFVCSIFVYI